MTEPDQPVVPMRDLDSTAEPNPLATTPRTSVTPNRLLAAVLLALSAIGVLLALLLPFYGLDGPAGGAFTSAPPAVRDGATSLFEIGAWGPLSVSGQSGVGFAALVTGATPYWGIPLIVITVLLAASAVLQLWGRRGIARLALVGTVGLFLGCGFALVTFLTSVLNVYDALGTVIERPGGSGIGLSATIGGGLWVLAIALVLAIVATVFGYRDRRNPIDQPVQRVEPDTPVLGFPLPEVSDRN